MPRTHLPTLESYTRDKPSLWKEKENITKDPVVPHGIVTVVELGHLVQGRAELKVSMGPILESPTNRTGHSCDVAAKW